MVGEFNKNRDIHPKVEALTGLSDTATELKLRIEELESVFDKSSNPIEQKGILKEVESLHSTLEGVMFSLENGFRKRG